MITIAVETSKKVNGEYDVVLEQNKNSIRIPIPDLNNAYLLADTIHAELTGIATEEVILRYS